MEFNKQNKIKSKMPMAEKLTNENSLKISDIKEEAGFIYFKKHKDDKVLEQEWLIDNIIPKEDLSYIYCDAGTGKSTLMGQISCAIATKQEELFEGIKIHATYNRVLLAAIEENPNRVMKRLQLQSKAINGKELIDMDNDSLIIYPEGEDLKKSLTNFIAEHNYEFDLLIIDSLTEYIAINNGDSNNQEKVRSLMNDFKELAHKHHIPVLFVGHTRKKNDTYLGSTAFKGVVRHMLSLQRDGKNASCLSVEKSNILDINNKNEYSYCLNFDPETKLSTIDMDRTEFNRSNINTIEDLNEEIAEYINQGLKAKDIVLRLKEDFGASYSLTSVQRSTAWVETHPKKKKKQQDKAA
jgi:RecA-family ATPase